MHGVGRALAALIAALSILAAGVEPARADDKKQAQQLFRQGLGHMLTGKYEAGCPALQQSYDLDPMPGTLFTLAECEAKWGHTADALRHYKDYLTAYIGMSLEQREKQKRRFEVSNTQVNALSGLVSYITITLATNAPVETVVKLDQRVLQPTELGTPIPIEPGAHRVVVEAPGSEPNEHTATVAKGEKVVLMVGKGGRLAPPKEAAPEKPKPKPKPEAKDDSDEGAGDAQRASAYVIGGLGLAGLIAGAGTGIAAIDQRNTAYESCLDTLCTADGKRAADEAQALGNASTATFIIGAAAIGTAIILLATAPDRKKAAATGRRLPVVIAAVDGSGIAVGIRGSW